MRTHLRPLSLCVALATLLPTVADALVLNNVLLQWREHAVKCEDPVQPDIEAMTHVAMFEAINAITPKYAPYAKKIDAPAGSSVDAAAASAAHEVLKALCPDQAAVYKGALEAALGNVEDTAARDAGASVGREAAAGVIAARADAGAARKDEMFAPNAAGEYAPTVPRVGTAVAIMRPWVMKTPDELRPAAPPALDSAEWSRDYQEIQRMGGKKSKDRRPEQTDIGKFWAGRDVRIVLPQLLSRPGRTLVDDARFLALAEMAWADSYASMMDGKYAYRFWRPVTAIRHLVDDGNPDTEVDPTWEPLVGITPPHPEYPCGHCLSAGAVGAVIEAEFGAAAPSIVLQDKDALLRRFDSPRDYIDDVSESRLLAGVHYRFSVDAGRDAGIALGKLTVERQLRLLSGSD